MGRWAQAARGGTCQTPAAGYLVHATLVQDAEGPIAAWLRAKACDEYRSALYDLAAPGAPLEVLTLAWPQDSCTHQVVVGDGTRLRVCVTAVKDGADMQSVWSPVLEWSA